MFCFVWHYKSENLGIWQVKRLELYKLKFNLKFLLLRWWEAVGGEFKGEKKAVSSSSNTSA